MHYIYIYKLYIHMLYTYAFFIHEMSAEKKSH